MDEMTEQLSGNLAANLRYIRSTRSITQSRLAKMASIPRSTIANIECGGGNPTLAVLVAMATALQVSIAELLSPPQSQIRMYPKGSLVVHKRGRSPRSVIGKLLPDPIPSMEIDRIFIPAGGGFRGSPHRAGTREYLYCERGTLTLVAGKKRHVLEAGDLCVFQGDQPHQYLNEGDEDAVGFGVVTLVGS
jgi:transcriptional regulator with XRE-family HTH domain